MARLDVHRKRAVREDDLDSVTSFNSTVVKPKPVVKYAWSADNQVYPTSALTLTLKGTWSCGSAVAHHTQC